MIQTKWNDVLIKLYVSELVVTQCIVKCINKLEHLYCSSYGWRWTAYGIWVWEFYFSCTLYNSNNLPLLCKLHKFKKLCVHIIFTNTSLEVISLHSNIYILKLCQYFILYFIFCILTKFPSFKPILLMLFSLHTQKSTLSQ